MAGYRARPFDAQAIVQLEGPTSPVRMAVRSRAPAQVRRTDK